MSQIEPNIIDPTKKPPPDTVPDLDPPFPGDDTVSPDDIREPGEDVVPIEKDPEEGGGPGSIERADQR